MENRAIGQEEETEVIMTGQSAAETYKKLLEMAENAEDVPTNFDQITESPEKLAEFIAEDRKLCHDISCSPNCTGCTKDGVLEWLMEKRNE